ncbi:MAG: glycosyltransferase family 4 protein [Anaerolineales bacterium]|nr:glycosyltransferase family 4 protein [Anaerolineales bacterium]
MKILHVVQGYTPAIGGTEYLIQKISETLTQEFGDEVTVFTTNCFNGEGFWNPRMPTMATGVSEINGVKIHRFPVRSRLSQNLRPIQKIFFQLNLPYNDWLRTYFGGPIIPHLAQSIAEFPADVVAASSFPLLHMFDTLKGARKGNKAVVFHGGLHPQDIWGFDRKNIYKAIELVDIYLANTDFEKKYLKNKGIDISKIKTVGCGVNPDDFSGITRDQARSLLNLPLDAQIVGYIGQIGLHKGIDTLIKAMLTVWQSHPHTILLVAGGKALYAKQLDALLSSLPEQYKENLALYFNFKEEEKKYLFNAIDIFAYPSGYESFGISYLEAWSAKKPVIGTWRGAIPYVIDAGQDGLLVPFQNCHCLAMAIVVLLDYAIYSSSLGINGFNKVLTKFTWKDVATRFRDGYKKAIEKTKRVNCQNMH